MRFCNVPEDRFGRGDGGADCPRAHERHILVIEQVAIVDNCPRQELIGLPVELLRIEGSKLGVGDCAGPTALTQASSQAGPAAFIPLSSSASLP